MDGLTRIAIRRRELGLTQAALAERLGVHVVTVARWETGDRKPDIPTLQTVAAALGTTVGALLGETELPLAAGSEG